MKKKIDKIKPFHIICLLSLLLSFQAQSQVFEAEDGIFEGVNKSTSHKGYSGSGYVTGFDQENDKLTVTFDIETSGKYQVYIGYSAPSGPKNNYVLINGDLVADVRFTETSNFSEINIGKIYLEKGENNISILKSWGWFEVDYFRIADPLPSAAWKIPQNPVNPNTTAEAVALYRFLLFHFGTTTFAGQFQSESKSYTDANSDIDYIHNITGKYPALYGNDLIDYSPSRIEHGSTSQAIEDVIKWHKNTGGMVTLTWHWNAPTDLPNTDEQPWWSGFYTRATNFDIKWVLENKESEKYLLLIRDIDAIAVELKRLQDENIPVLWRPLHEAEGAWFWWGAKGPEACVELWQLLYDRLTNHHQINNLLWVWTTTDSENALQWYPGDDYVDILGVDVYLPNGNYGASPIMFENLRNIFDGKRMLTMSENGTIPSPEKMLTNETRWLYNCTWTGDFIFNNEVNSMGHKISFFNHGSITTLDELPAAWEKYTGIDIKKKRITEIISPNPASDFVTIRFFERSTPLKVSLINSKGQIIRSLEINKPVTSVNFPLEGINSGIYFVSVYTNIFVETQKITIDR
ncbi:MAG: T9SS type A sorting domain-containing protein [Prolixibacteraceae bacterium]|nr:T9SS type A sorting domain-containing protein [Prolixibacteraceae bacterium]